MIIGDTNHAVQFVARDLLLTLRSDPLFSHEGYSKEDFLGVGIKDGNINGQSAFR